LCIKLLWVVGLQETSVIMVLLTGVQNNRASPYLHPHIVVLRPAWRVGGGDGHVDGARGRGGGRGWRGDGGVLHVNDVPFTTPTTTFFLLLLTPTLSLLSRYHHLVVVVRL
jgi:hypothetical protein